MHVRVCVCRCIHLSIYVYMYVCACAFMCTIVRIPTSTSAHCFGVCFVVGSCALCMPPHVHCSQCSSHLLNCRGELHPCSRHHTLHPPLRITVVLFSSTVLVSSLLYPPASTLSYSEVFIFVSCYTSCPLLFSSVPRISGFSPGSATTTIQEWNAMQHISPPLPP